MIDDNPLTPIKMTIEEEANFISAMATIRSIFLNHNLCTKEEFADWFSEIDCASEVYRYSPDSRRVDQFTTTFDRILKKLE